MTNPATATVVVVAIHWINEQLSLITPAFTFAALVAVLIWTIYRIHGQRLENKLKQSQLDKITNSVQDGS